MNELQQKLFHNIKHLCVKRNFNTAIMNLNFLMETIETNDLNELKNNLENVIDEIKDLSSYKKMILFIDEIEGE